MDDVNPYAAPCAPLPPRKRRVKRETGPILYSFVVITVATLLLGFSGLLVSLFSVGSFWVYKLIPRPPAPESEGAREFLRNLEAPPARRETAPEVILPTVDDPAVEVFREIRL